jgi:hypothetical protein
MAWKDAGSSNETFKSSSRSSSHNYYSYNSCNSSFAKKAKEDHSAGDAAANLDPKN